MNKPNEKETQRRQFSQMFNAFHQAVSAMGGNAYNLLNNPHRLTLLEAVEKQLYALTEAGEAFHSDASSDTAKAYKADTESKTAETSKTKADNAESEATKADIKAAKTQLVQSEKGK